MTNWKVKEQGGDEREWGKETRADVEEALEEFDWMDLVVVSPTGQELSREEFLEGGNSTEETTQTPPEDPRSLEEGVDAEVIDMTEEEVAEGYQDQNDVEPSKGGGNAPTQTENGLPDKPPVDTDPLEWVPSDFIDHIEGQPAINRKGYEVIAHHFNISVETECLISPNETDFEYAEVKATATTKTGEVYKAHGSAHVDRGDDSYLLLEMADTRAAKRAIARATGVGMIAVEELQNEL